MERKILQRMEQLEKIKISLEKRLQGVQIRKVECIFVDITGIIWIKSMSKRKK